MNFGDKKLTSEETEKIRELYKSGMSYAGIGRTMNPPRDHTTILFWVRRLKLGSRLKTIICEYCKKPKAIPTYESRRFCSSECYQAFVKSSGLEKAEMEKIIRCEKCGREIPKYIEEQGKKCFACWWQDRKIISTLTKKF